MIDEITEKLLKEHAESVHAIILYGSYADGSNDELSDIDIVVVIDDVFGDRDSALSTLDSIGNKRLSAHVLDNGEFEEKIVSGDLTYRYGVLDRGRILYEKDDYIVRIMRCLDSSFKIDFDAMIVNNYSMLYLKEKSIKNYFNAMVTSIMYCCSFIVHSYFAAKKVEARGFDHMIELMGEDEKLSKYAGEILRLMEIRKEFSHNKRPIDFDELEGMHRLHLELKENFPIKSGAKRRKPAAFDF